MLKPHSRSKETRTVSPSSRDTIPMQLALTMCDEQAPSRVSTTSPESTFLKVDHRVSSCRWLADALASQVSSLVSGENRRGSSASFARVSSSGKMCQAQGALFESAGRGTSSSRPHSPPYSATFPRSGMMLSGSLSAFPTLAALMSESGSSWSAGEGTSWPTATAEDSQRGKDASSKSGAPSLTAAVTRQWPTATSSSSGEARNATSTRPENTGHHPGRRLLDEVILEGADPFVIVDAGAVLAEKLRQNCPSSLAQPTDQRGYLSPTWVEMLMGFPQGWTVAAMPPTVSRRVGRARRCATSPTTDGPHDPERLNTTTSRPASRRKGHSADRG